MAAVCHRTWGLIFFPFSEGHRLVATAVWVARRCSDCVPAQAPTGPGRERGFVGLTASFPQPDRDNCCGLAGQRDGSLFAALAGASHVRAGSAGVDIGAVQTNHLRNA